VSAAETSACATASSKGIVTGKSLFTARIAVEALW